MGNKYLNILIVDDEEDLTWSIAKRLRVSHEFGQILCANSAEQALDIMTSSEIHLIVSDIRMPGMGGIELIKAVHQIYPKVVIIVMSAHSCLDDLNQFKDIIQFIEKPFEIDELKFLINKSLHFKMK